MRLKHKVILFVFALIMSVGIATVGTKLLTDAKDFQKEAFETSTVVYKSKELKIKPSKASNTNRGFSDGNQETKKLMSQATKKILVEDFPLGWYDTIEDTKTPSKVSREGMNILLPYVGKNDDKTITAYLDAASAAGMKVVLDIPRHLTKAGDIPAVTKFVRSFKTHPAVFAWYLFDEPGPRKVSPAILKNLYRTVKAEDPTKPIAIVFQNEKHIDKYIDATDILMLDRYPVSYNSPEFAGVQWSEFQNNLNTATKYAQAKKDCWFVLQGFGKKQDGTPQFNRRLPRENELRYMIYSAVLAGADGFLFWTHYRTQQVWIDSILTPIIQEIYNYIPAFEAGAISEKIKLDRSNIQANLYQDPQSGSRFLVAVNHRKETVKANFEFSSPISINSVKLLRDNRSVPLNNRRFSDSFSGYAAHVYQIN